MKFFSILLAIPFLAVSTQSLTNKSARGKQEGYIINNDGVKIDGFIHVKSATIDQLKIRFTSKDGKAVYKASDIKGYGYSYYGETQFGHDGTNEVKYASKEAEDAPIVFMKPGEMFMEIEETGYASVYTYFIENNGDIKNPTIHNFYLERKSTNEFIKVTKENYQEIATEFFSDCPEISTMIGQVNHRYRHLPKVVKAYNKWAANRENTADF